MQTDSEAIRPAIIIPAFSRPAAFRRLIQSIQNAHFPDDVHIILSIDGGADPATIEYAHEFNFHTGNVEVIERKENLGLREHILWCGDQSKIYGSVIVLEDDLLVDPWFYFYAVEALTTYAISDEIAGIALYSPRYNEYAQLPFEALNNGLSAYWMQVPCSWGQAWTASQWRNFRTWYDDLNCSLEDVDTVIPREASAWATSSWKKYFVAYLAVTDKYFVYPYLSYTTNCSDSGGTHIQRNTALHQVALPSQNRVFSEPSFPAGLEEAVTYDVFMEPQLTIDFDAFSLPKGSVEFDLNASKPRRLLVDSDYCLTTRPVKGAVATFPLRFRPLEMNIILDGGESTGGPIRLCRRDQLYDREPMIGRARSLYNLKWYFLTGRMSGVSLLLFGFVTILRRIAGRSGD
jgi:hypothetical protein